MHVIYHHSFLNVFLTTDIYLFILKTRHQKNVLQKKTGGGARLREEIMDVSKCGHSMCF